MTMHEGEGEMEVMPAMTEDAARMLAQQLYVAYYGRPADPAGLAFWTDEFMNSDNLDNAIAEFGNSEEYAALSMGMENADLVTALYQRMFNRPPEMEGLEFYEGLLDSGEATLASIAKQIADGAMDSDATTLANKVMVANTFTAAVEEGGENVVYDASQIAHAAALLADVGESSASVTAGNTAVESLVGMMDGGMEYMLTPGRDIIESGTSNDTYTGNSDTVAANDIIEDASKTDHDTLNINNTGGVLGLTVSNVEYINVNQDLFDGRDTDGTDPNVHNHAINLSKVTGASVTVSSDKLGFDGRAVVAGIGNNMLTLGDNVTDLIAGDVNDAVIDLGSAKNAMICTVDVDPPGDAIDKTGPTIIINGDVTLNVKGSTNEQTIGETGAYTYAPTYTLRGTDDAKVTFTAARDGEDATDDLVKFTVDGDGDMQLIMVTGANGANIVNAKDSGTLTVVTNEAGSTNVSKVDATVAFASDEITAGAVITAAGGQNIVISKAQANAFAVAGTKATDALSVTTGGNLTAGITFSTAASATLNVSGDKDVTIGAITVEAPNRTAVSVASAEANVTVGSINAANVNFSGVAKELTIGSIAINSTVTGGSGMNTVSVSDVAPDAANNPTTFSFSKELGYTGGSGTDALTALGVADGGILAAELGGGNDRVVLNNSTTFGGAEGGIVAIDGGSGTDTVILTNGADLTGLGLTVKGVEALALAGNMTEAKDGLDAAKETIAVTVGLTQLTQFPAIAMADGRDEAVDLGVVTVMSGTADIDLSKLVVVGKNVSFLLNGDNATTTKIVGTMASDTIDAGESDGDTITGGRGADTFVFADGDSMLEDGDTDNVDKGYNPMMVDTITDYSGAQKDNVQLLGTGTDSRVELETDGNELITMDVDTGEVTDAQVANITAGKLTYSVEDGLLTLGGVRADRDQVDTLSEWIELALHATEDGKVVAFQFAGDTYLLEEGSGDVDNLIKLAGVTGVTLTENPDDAGSGTVLLG
ncbi:MAG: DUF4214 domain-containing protein [Halieaceae bacterium]|nr:DUF4214 domain-containing protein [Halieaceae bacterium]